MKWKKIKKLSPVLILLLVIAFVWIPTGTIDDLVTTLPIINYFGLKTFIIVSLILIGLIWLNGGDKLLKILK